RKLSASQFTLVSWSWQRFFHPAETRRHILEGMLELPSLVLSGWLRANQPDSAHHGWHRLISDENGAPLGVALWRPLAAPRWLDWALPPRVAVHESDDEPLLFTAQRVWIPLPKWEVRDADSR